MGSGDIDFRFLETRFAGSAGARDAFERLIADIVGIVHPDVQEIQANPGDWGIDAYVGDLGRGGEVHIWQSKYFINGFGTTQQGDVRESYKSAQKAAKANGYKIASWTLCIPCELDGPMLTWWEGWKKRTSKADTLTVNLDTAGGLRRRLQAPAAAAVRNHYFSPIFPLPPTTADPEEPRGLEELVDNTKYDGALFVRQMDEAGLPETFAAREAFFNAEILEREVTDKGVQPEISALSTWRVRVSSTWSTAFNTACQMSADRRFPQLYSEVLGGIETSHAQEAASLRAHVLHGVGLLHQAVDNGRAGWVRDWRDVAEVHRAPIPSIASGLNNEEGREEVS
ncbi:serine/threonine protein kinase [Arthrobacter sp. B0490]|uniref:serine/threonine protein kinase n=1 Tax=Arthrobacter sp. B0490 TaxID=2058891 RepID=UPI0011B05172|nr:serine/threonine protein kinase [Arthrobacter sp. B0490]